MSEKQNKLMSLFTETNAKKLAIHVSFLVVIVVCAAWVYVGSGAELPWGTSDKADRNEKMMQHTMVSQEMRMEDMPHETFQTSGNGTITSRDKAVAGYLDGAQTLAEVYRFTNNGSYAGLCEQSDRLYTLEGESGGILKYIKMVGATEVFCSTGESSYLIEAKEPDSGLFYCIDSTGASVEQKETREGKATCQ